MLNGCVSVNRSAGLYVWSESHVSPINRSHCCSYDFASGSPNLKMTPSSFMMVMVLNTDITYWSHKPISSLPFVICLKSYNLWNILVFRYLLTRLLHPKFENYHEIWRFGLAWIWYLREVFVLSLRKAMLEGPKLSNLAIGRSGVRRY